MTPTCANCLEIWKPQPPGTLTASPGIHRNCFTSKVCRSRGRGGGSDVRVVQFMGRYKNSMGGEIICGISNAVHYLATSAKSFPINDSTCSDIATRFNISSLKFGSKYN